ncbi:ORF6N domain-containing protein [Komagataeibacter sp. FXV3]|uniref:ORF6N domain-containing protein n=1 Tax=Komagataeibacter sp. FXV3 TaxID=2608998 RepID=UPI00187B165E|nr:ORF6N domain-containing protein [Komagataeibacter sp. FXV3]MBE7729438.1 ORF6N domain-containing protein [Komagataeibacter sp. FXV3]
MSNVTINGRPVSILEYLGQRVVTLAMIDDLHGRPKDTARKRFNENKRRFVEGEDYFVRNPDEARELGFTAPNGLTLLTESGYLMLVKSFTDDLAWTVQRELVTGYFRAPRQPDLPRNTLATMEPTELNARIGACRQASRQWGKSAGAWAWMKAGLPRPPRELLSVAENAVLDAVNGTKPTPSPVQRRIMIIEDVQGGSVPTPFP